MTVFGQQSLHILLGKPRQIQAQMLLWEFEEMEPVDDIILAYHGAYHAVECVAMEHFAFFEVIRRAGQAKNAPIFR